MRKEKYRSTKHLFLLYPDDASHVAAFDMIKGTYEYVAVLHDSDLEKDGSLKKSHYHVMIVTKNATWNTAVCKFLSIKENYCQEVRNYDAAIGYLVHINEPDKHQYSVDCILGTDRLILHLKKLIEKRNDITEGEKVIQLLDLIDNADKHITLTSFARYAAANGRYDIFRRGAGIFIKIIEEKNTALQNV